MQIKGFFSNSSALFQLGVLLYFILIGLLLNTAIGHAVVYIAEHFFGSKYATESYEGVSFYATHASQLLSSILIFILPALITAYFCSNKPIEFLKIKRHINIKVLLLSAIMLFLIAPVIDITSSLNSKIHLPDFLAPVTDWMQKTEEHTAGITEKTLSEEGFFALVTNIFIIGIMAGVAEEFFFRGALTSIITKKIKNPHTVIWLVAIIFSIIHFQFSGFIPRMLLGAFLGYLLYWTKNIWVPVFVHFLNNTIAIIGYKLGFFKLSNESPALISSDTNIFTTIVAVLAGLTFFIICKKKIKKINLKEQS